MTAINASTFEPNGTVENHSFGTIEDGTVEVTLGRETRRVRASRWTTPDENRINAYGVSGRYNTGTKAWPASITLCLTGRRAGMETARFGRDDRDPKFNKMRGIFFS